ncbi:MAG: glycosyltransferase [Isosphaeraceae bacterium]
MGNDGEGGGRRIVLATFGSLGDLHPFLALAKGLQARGHRPVVASSGYHRKRVEPHGLEFEAIGPPLDELENDPEVFRRAMDRKGGPEYVIRELLMPYLRHEFDDLSRVCQGADLLVGHTIVFSVPLVAAMQKLPWASVAIAPLVMFSPHDTSIPPVQSWIRHLRPLGPRFWKGLLSLAKRSVAHWSAPVRELRAELGLPPGADPIFEGAFSPDLTLALFSRVLQSPQPDWPASTIQVGFAFSDRREPGQGLDPALNAFLEAGSPPVVLTLGSSAVNAAGNFYEEGLAAVASLGRRAVLLVGRDPRNVPPGPLPDSVLVAEYAPYSELLPRAAAVVHQGGVGTTAQALRAGVPMLVVPWSHDQPDNAHRVTRLGVGLTIDRDRFDRRSASRALRRLLEEPSFATRARSVGETVRSEKGVEAACDALEAYLARPRS